MYYVHALRAQRVEVGGSGLIGPCLKSKKANRGVA